MKMYCCQPQVTDTIDPYSSKTSQVPTFYLHPNVQGIVSVQHASNIVRDICNPTGDEDIAVTPNVTEVFIE